jgi:hypothetical protein
MIRKVLLALVAVAVMACVSQAQSKPDLSGTWKLNPSKSQFNEYMSLNSRTDVIAQDGDKFTQKVTASSNQGDLNYTLSFIADGKSVDVPANSPAANQGVLTLLRISAAWQDSSLIVSEDLNYQGQVDITTKLTYDLSKDGKTLTIESHTSTQMGDISSKLVFEKQ